MGLTCCSSILGLDVRGHRRDPLRALRDDPATAPLPILLVTDAVRQVEERAAQLAALGSRVVLKPFALEDLLSRVRAPGGVMGNRPPYLTRPRQCSTILTIRSAASSMASV